MADKTKKEEMVTFRVPTKRGENTLFVGLNFKNYLMTRGEYVTVPKAVYDVIMESERAEEFANTKLQRMEAAYLKKAANPIDVVAQ